MNQNANKSVTPDSNKYKILKCLYIQNSIKYKENCDEDLKMLKHRISDLKRLAGTLSGNIRTAGIILEGKMKKMWDL